MYDFAAASTGLRLKLFTYLCILLKYIFWEKKTKQGFAIAHMVYFMCVLLFFSLF